MLEAVVGLAGVEKAHLSKTIMAQVLTAAQGQNPARQAHVNAGLPVDSAAWGVNQVCGSRLRAAAYRVTLPSSVIKLCVSVLTYNWEFNSSKHHLPLIWSSGIDMVQLRPVRCPEVVASQALAQHLSNALWSNPDAFGRLQPAPGIAVLERAAVTGLVSRRSAPRRTSIAAGAYPLFRAQS